MVGIVASATALIASQSDWIGAIGGAAGIYAFVSQRLRRRPKFTVDYTTANDAHFSWHDIILTNISDLEIHYRAFGPAWFADTAFGARMLDYAFDTEDFDPNFEALGSRQSRVLRYMDDDWRPARLTKVPSAYLRVGIEVPYSNRVHWIKPRRSRDWEPTFRERLIDRLYGYSGVPQP